MTSEVVTEYPNCPQCGCKVSEVLFQNSIVTSSPDGQFVNGAFIPGSYVENKIVSTELMFQPCGDSVYEDSKEGQQWIKQLPRPAKKAPPVELNRIKIEIPWKNNGGNTMPMPGTQIRVQDRSIGVVTNVRHDPEINTSFIELMFIEANLTEHLVDGKVQNCAMCRACADVDCDNCFGGNCKHYKRTL